MTYQPYTPKEHKAFVDTVLQTYKILEKQHVLMINPDDCTVHLNKSSFWDGKTDEWRQNFLKQIYRYCQRSSGTDQYTIQVYTIDENTLLGKFSQDEGLLLEK